ncbi:MAG TPA: ATP-binding protein, partial [Gemmatimonadales bacterium]|nr:ATP-binding protein [Gemmatimonadales bacterium]
LQVRLPESRADEFGGVYRSFNRMATRLRRARGALIRETRRTETIVAEAATGVLALDAEADVELVNPRAAEILQGTLEVGMPLPRTSPALRAVADAVNDFWRSAAPEAGAELEVESRILRLRMRRLMGAGAPGGAVIALEDVTREVRSARVLAWGEMARQVAHEIKNPLTPMRLGLQHLRRVYRDGRPEFDRTLEETADRMLAEIDRLDTIARAFSRFAAPTREEQPLDRIDLAVAVGEVVQLYRLAAEGCEVRLSAEPGAAGAARADEVKEVMVNLLENARNAGAQVVEVEVRPGCIRVSDDGSGIPAELLPRIFEPRFSTTTSGSGLGLAIVRRLVEGWGGTIEVESGEGRGTEVTVRVPV